MSAILLSSLCLIPLAPAQVQETEDDPLEAAPAQETGDDPFEAAIVRLVEAFLDEHDIPGLSLSIGVGGETFLARGWGYSDPGVPAEAEALYRAGSLTGHLAAVAALVLAEEERLDLDADVGGFFPELAGPGEEGAEAAQTEVRTGVRIRDLMAHTSGLADYSYGLRPRDERGHPSREEILAWLPAQPPEGDPGRCFGYSKTDTLLLGWIVEDVADRELPRFFEERFFQPLGLQDTKYVYDGPTIHAESTASQEVAGLLVEDGSGLHPFAAEGLCTSAEDLRAWLRALVDGRLLSDASFDDLTTSQRLPDGSETGFGFGVSLAPLDGETCISLGGGLAGSRLHAAYYPAYDLIIAVLAADEAARVDRIERRIARRFLQLEDPEIQDLLLEAEDLARYVGGYYEGCNRIDVRASEGRLHLIPSIPGETTMDLLYQGSHRFVAAHDHEIRVTFELRGERAVGFLLSQRGVERRAVRLD